MGQETENRPFDFAQGKLRTGDGRQRTERRRQGTEDGGQRTGDGEAEEQRRVVTATAVP
jgi:hypothetical protein